MAKSFMEHMLEASYDVLERKRCKALCKITRQDGAVGWGCLIYEPKVQNPDWSEYFIITSCKLIPKENFDAEKYQVEFTKPNSKLKCFQLESIIKKNPLYDTSGLVVIFVDSECSDLNHGRFRHKHSSILKDLEPKIGVKESKPLFCYIESNRFKYMLEKLVPKKDGSCLPSHAECCSTVLLEGERNTNLKAVGILNFEVNEQQLTFHPVWFKKSKVEHILGLPEKPTIQDDKDEKDVKFTLTWLAPNTKFTNVSPEYRVELWKKHLTGSSKLCQQGRTDGTQFKTTDLEYNSEYEVKLFTVNKHGESEQEVVTFKTNTEQTRQELQQMKSEINNINEKLDTQMRDGTKNGETTTEILREMKGEIQVMKQKLEDSMSGLSPNKRPGIEGYSSVELITQLQQMQLDASKGNDETDLKIELKKIASDKGFTIVDNEGSGNCMFYALSDQLEFAMGIKIKYDELRQILVQYLRENPELPDGTDLFPFVHGHQSWADYLTYMEQDGVWGDHVILCAAANCYKTCIHVVSSLSTVHDVILRPQCPVDKSRTLVLGHIHEVHYVSLHSTQEKTRQELQQMRSEVRNINEKLDSLMRDDTRNGDSTTEKLSETKREIQMVKRKLEDLVSRPPPNKIPRMEDAFDPTEMIENISQLYKTREGTINLLPWCEDLNFSFGDLYTRLKITYKEKTRGIATDRVVTISEIFNPHEKCEEPRVVLIEGKPGMGKTTYCKKVVFDWATQKRAAGNSFAKFCIVLLIKCREVQSDLWEAIDDQLLPRDIGDDQRKRFFDFIRQNQSKVLLVLDGLDEVSEKKLPMLSEIIQGRTLPKCRVVVAARHEAGVKVRKYCDTLLEVEGFTEEDVKTFIKKYFREKTNLAEQLIERLHDDKTLHEMSTNPLNTALICLVYEDLNGVFPESRSKLYMDIVDCILRRYRARKQLSEVDEADLVVLYESQLNHLGSIALKSLLEDNLDFDEKELGKHKGSDLPELGFLSVQPGGSKLRATRRYGFLHKTFQEFFAALNLVCQLIKKEISTDSIAVDRRYRHELKEVLLFTFGILAARCEETAENLMKSMATQLNQEVEQREAKDSMTVILECIYECKNENNFHVKLARALGPCLQIETITVFPTLRLDGAKTILLTNILRTNTSMTALDVFGNEIRDDGAAALANCLKGKTSLKELKLSVNKIGDDGAAALAECLKENKSWETLDLGENAIGEAGAAALAGCFKENTSLTYLNLSYNEIGDDGAAALAECLKENKSLQTLELNGTDIGEAGAAVLAEFLKENSCLEKIYLIRNNIGESGAAALADCFKENTSLTYLSLTLNKIGDEGAASLAECLKENKSLQTLDLDETNMGKAGAASLAECLKENTSLTDLYLTSNKIGDDGAASLAECLKENKSLQRLDLDDTDIGEAGAAALAERLKENTSLTYLRLSFNKIGDDGAASLAECLKENKSLQTLDLEENDIGEAGAASLAECLKENTSLTDLSLCSNKIGDDGAASLAECLKENKSLQKLDLDENDIGEAGAAVLAEFLKENSSLKSINLNRYDIGEAGVVLISKLLW